MLKNLPVMFVLFSESSPIYDFSSRENVLLNFYFRFSKLLLFLNTAVSTFFYCEVIFANFFCSCMFLTICILSFCITLVSLIRCWPTGLFGCYLDLLNRFCISSSIETPPPLLILSELPAAVLSLVSLIVSSLGNWPTPAVFRIYRWALS